tara:strand:+ start:1001 stop:1810 length:810 start_codon:yes stop_codon:yes gene_type:complete
MYNKLITHEDPYHLHKTLGVYVLAHFLFQYTYYFINGNMILNEINILPHVGLHLSSFIFSVLKKRQMGTMGMFIWEELRLHSMIFASRGCFSVLYPSMRIPFVFITMGLADLATYYYGDKNISTVRGDHTRESNRIVNKLYSIFFSTSQLGATIICGGFFQQNYSTALVFSTLPAIQTSAFGLTLIRKNIINKTIWQIVYGVELLLVYILWYSETNNLFIIPLSFSCYLARKMNISKYYLFYCIVVIDYFWRYEGLYESILEKLVLKIQ